MQLWKILIILGLFTVFSCNSNPNTSALSGASAPLSSFPSNTVSSNLRISMTDAPSRDLKSVFVNVAHVELFIKRGSSEARLIVAQNLGMVDLLTLRNGVLLPLQDVQLPVGVEVKSIRLVLKSDNNHGIKADNSRCEMQTPSGQQSGIKVHLAAPFVLENNYVYSMVMDFDAEKSVVIKGNGDCLLKPVLKLLQVTRTTTIVHPPPVGSGEEPVDPVTLVPEPIPVPIPEPITDGTDTNPGADFEIPIDVMDPPVMSEAQINQELAL